MQSFKSKPGVDIVVVVVADAFVVLISIVDPKEGQNLLINIFLELQSYGRYNMTHHNNSTTITTTTAAAAAAAAATTTTTTTNNENNNNNNNNNNVVFEKINSTRTYYLYTH